MGFGPFEVVGAHADADFENIFTCAFRKTGEAVDDRLRQAKRPVSALLAGLLVAAAALARNRQRLAWALATLAVLDLLALARHRPIDTAPLRPMTAQSPALAALSAGPRGSRVVSGLRNMPMVVLPMKL